MKRMDRVLVLLIRGTGLFQVVTGLAFWLGYELRLIPVHMAVGSVFVLSVSSLAVRSGFAGSGWGLSLFTLAWSVGVIALGMNQAQILPGQHHWLIRLLHLLVGIAAMGWADRLAQRIRRAGRTAPALNAQAA